MPTKLIVEGAGYDLNAEFPDGYRELEFTRFNQKNGSTRRGSVGIEVRGDTSDERGRFLDIKAFVFDDLHCISEEVKASYDSRGASEYTVSESRFYDGNGNFSNKPSRREPTRAPSDTEIGIAFKLGNLITVRASSK